MLAQYALSGLNLTNNTVSVGNVRIGTNGTNTATGTTTLTLSNAAITNTTPTNVTEQLSNSYTLGGGGTNVTLSNNLIFAQASTNFTAGLLITNAGTNNTGTINLTYYSVTNGTGAVRANPVGATNIGSQTVTLTGVGYQAARASYAVTNISLGNIHVGGTFGTTNLSISNASPSNTYTETLGVAIGSSNGATATGSSFTNLAGGASTNVFSVSLDSTNLNNPSGPKSGTLILNNTTYAVNNSGLGSAFLGSTTITVTGGVYNYAAAGLSTNVSLGNTHVGVAFTNKSVAITNISPSGSYTEGLDVAISATNGANASGSIINLGGGSNSTNISVGGLSVTNSGASIGTVTLANTSSGSNSGLANTVLGNSTITITGGVYAYAVGSVTNLVNLGRVHAGGSFVATNLLISNSATGLTNYVENLAATLTNASGVSGSGSVTDLAVKFQEVVHAKES